MRVVSVVWATDAMRQWVLLYLGLELLAFAALFKFYAGGGVRRLAQRTILSFLAVVWDEDVPPKCVAIQAAWRALSQLLLAVLPGVVHGVCGDGESVSQHGCLPTAWLWSMVAVWFAVYPCTMHYFVRVVVMRGTPPCTVTCMSTHRSHKAASARSRRSRRQRSARARRRRNDGGGVEAGALGYAFEDEDDDSSTESGASGTGSDGGRGGARDDDSDDASITFVPHVRDTVGRL